jgi:hypothetical protein
VLVVDPDGVVLDGVLPVLMDEPVVPELAPVLPVLCATAAPASNTAPTALTRVSVFMRGSPLLIED